MFKKQKKLVNKPGKLRKLILGAIIGAAVGSVVGGTIKAKTDKNKK